MVKVDFLVIDCPSAYNVILGRPTLNKIGTIISTACLIVKFLIDSGKITTVKADQATACHCYKTSLKIQKVKNEGSRDSPRLPSSSKVIMVDLDAR